MLWSYLRIQYIIRLVGSRGRCMRILVFCHPSVEDLWSSRSVSTGIGGSEEAVIHVTAGLAARGHDVTVVNARSGLARSIGGVTWTSYEALPAQAADVGVIWRRPRRIYDVRSAARRFYLWLHDFIPEADILPHLDAFAKVMVLSRFHRLGYPAIQAERIFVTSNGVDPAGFSDAELRRPQQMVYG